MRSDKDALSSVNRVPEPPAPVHQPSKAYPVLVGAASKPTAELRLATTLETAEPPWVSKVAVIVHFATEGDMKAFAKMVKRPVEKTTRYLWFPEQPVKSVAGKSYKSREP